MVERLYVLQTIHRDQSPVSLGGRLIELISSQAEQALTYRTRFQGRFVTIWDKSPLIFIEPCSRML